jgi:uncharacterized protein (DUF302 family)
MNAKLGVIIGFILGSVMSLFIMGIAFKVAAPTMFFKEIKSGYDFDKTVNLIVNRINNQKGWHVTTVIDQQKEILENGGVDVGRVKIIKFCNAKLSGEMLHNDASKYMSVKMPLSISVYEKSNGEVMIGMMNGYIMARLFAGTHVGDIMENVVKDIESVMSFLHFRFTLF